MGSSVLEVGQSSNRNQPILFFILLHAFSLHTFVILRRRPISQSGQSGSQKRMEQYLFVLDDLHRAAPRVHPNHFCHPPPDGSIVAYRWCAFRKSPWCPIFLSFFTVISPTAFFFLLPSLVPSLPGEPPYSRCPRMACPRRGSPWRVLLVIS